MQSDSLQLIEVYSNLKLGKELLGNVSHIHPYSRLDEILDTPFSESYSLVIVGGEISPLFLHQWLHKHTAKLQGRFKVIYVYDFLTKADIILLSECEAIFKIIHRQEPLEIWQKAWQEVVSSFSGLLATKDIMGRVRAQNKVLNELNENLEKIVEQRTQHLEISKKEIEIKNKEIRELIKFIKSLSNVQAFEDLLLILKHEFIRYHKVEAPIMVYSLYPHAYRCISFQGPQIIDRSIDKIKIENFLNDPLKLRDRKSVV